MQSLMFKERFENLKIWLAMAAILKVVDPYKDYITSTDASNEGLVGILSQEGHVVCDESHKLKGNK